LVKLTSLVVAAGITPNTQVVHYAREIELDKENKGIVVNAELQVLSDIYAAGDVASFYDMSLGEHRRVEHWDHAEHSGLIAAQNMLGKKEKYYYQPFFWSDIGPIGFEVWSEL
jgi:programmed cell death 8 (apoptosis-inducing factor)